MPPVPKKKHTKKRSGERMAGQRGIKLPSLTKCPSCKKLKETHKVCPNCGYYR